MCFTQSRSHRGGYGGYDYSRLSAYTEDKRIIDSEQEKGTGPQLLRLKGDADRFLVFVFIRGDRVRC